MEFVELAINEIRKLYINLEDIDPIKRELEEFLEVFPCTDINFAKRAMFSEEIKSNNLVEGYLDNLEYIDKVVNEANASNSKDQRILNLYNGYRYILENKDINKDNLKELYAILSNRLLIDYDLDCMGDYYREDEVFIYNSSNVLSIPDNGIDYRKVDSHMDKLFDYINSGNDFMSKTDYYIKSQIMHFYFVYIHPYFDVNGRTSRTVSMWYLLNHEIYPYIIFNRGINLAKSLYYKAIVDTRKYGNITIFLKYMMENVKYELEKEYVISMMELEGYDFNMSQRQTLNYILSMNQDINLKTFRDFYNRFNDKKSLRKINDEFIEPLMDMGVIDKGRDTKGYIYDNKYNFMFNIKDEVMDFDKSKIKRLKL